MYTVQDVSKEIKREPNAIYRAIRLVEIYRNYEFQKEGRSYSFNEQEKNLLADVVKQGVAAAKPTTEYGKEMVI